MSKRIVAMYAKWPKEPSHENAFHNRSRKATNDVLSFRNGKEFLQNLKYFFGSNNIDVLRVHSHGTRDGIVAQDWDGGIYTQESFNNFGTSNAIATYDIAGAVRDRQIKFAQNAHIILYGCNNSIFALELCRYLNFHGRKDIFVSGADNFVEEVSSGARADSMTTGISRGKAGRFHTFNKGVVVKSVAIMPYK